MATRRRSSSRRVTRSSRWGTFSMLATTVLLTNAIAVILNGLELAVYQSTLTDATVAVRNSLAVGLTFGLFTFVWGLILIAMVNQGRNLRTIAILIGLTSLVSLIAVLAAGWFPPAPEALAAYPVIGAYKGATVALYSSQILLYFVLSSELMYKL
jgi:CHASE2 domain-containing sensor protein